MSLLKKVPNCCHRLPKALKIKAYKDINFKISVEIDPYGKVFLKKRHRNT